MGLNKPRNTDGTKDVVNIFCSIILIMSSLIDHHRYRSSIQSFNQLFTSTFTVELFTSIMTVDCLERGYRCIHLVPVNCHPREAVHLTIS